MYIFTDKLSLNSHLFNERLEKKKIGFVPTMGALHEGHARVIDFARKDCEIVVCSIFVNPVQFDNAEDLAQYPRTLKEDYQKLESANCDVVYVPPVEDIYHDPENIQTHIRFGPIEDILEGDFRPGHFKGVGLVVAKLFNIINPDYTYFGQKDLQQVYLIKQLITDLSFNIKLVPVPTVREADGLAMSSRNRRISQGDRPAAAIFYQALISAREQLKSGKSIPEVKKAVKKLIDQVPALSLEYFEVVNTADFSITEVIHEQENTALCIAGYINNIRLIDNVMYIN